MKKRFFAIILALTLCAGLVTPAFAEDTESVTVAGITFDAIATDQHESYRDFLEEYVAEGYSWAPAQLAAAGPMHFSFFTFFSDFVIFQIVK